MDEYNRWCSRDDLLYTAAYLLGLGLGLGLGLSGLLLLRSNKQLALHHIRVIRVVRVLFDVCSSRAAWMPWTLTSTAKYPTQTLSATFCHCIVAIAI